MYGKETGIRLIKTDFGVHSAKICLWISSLFYTISFCDRLHSHTHAHIFCSMQGTCHTRKHFPRNRLINTPFLSNLGGWKKQNTVSIRLFLTIFEYYSSKKEQQQQLFLCNLNFITNFDRINILKQRSSISRADLDRDQHLKFRFSLWMQISYIIYDICALINTVSINLPQLELVI